MLSLRLSKILEFISVDDIVADIGCDHGYLLVGCLNKGISFVQGVENKEGPYKQALLNLNDYISNNKAILTLNDGLEQLNSMINTIVIAGMGGELISKILFNHLDIAKKMKKLILQPNLRNEELRIFLSNNYFEIINEEIIEEDHKFYEILIIRYNENTQKLNQKQCYFGPILMKNKSKVFLKKWQQKLSNLQAISKTTTQKIEKIEKQITMIKEILT